jgi:hypothetical protein
VTNPLVFGTVGPLLGAFDARWVLRLLPAVSPAYILKNAQYASERIKNSLDYVVRGTGGRMTAGLGKDVLTKDAMK